jgi:hypothetical protein
MTSFEKRLAELERVIAGESVYVIKASPHMSTRAAIAAVGIKPRPFDLVVFLKNYADPAAAPELLHRRPVSATPRKRGLRARAGGGCPRDAPVSHAARKPWCKIGAP